MSMAAEVTGQGGVGQVEVGVKEAAQIVGVSTKQVRRWIREGVVRANLRDGKFGPQWQIESSSLPPARVAVDTTRQGVGQGGRGVLPGVDHTPANGGEGIAAALLGVLAEKDRALDDRRRELEAAAGRVGYLEAQLSTTKALTERAESLVDVEQGRARDMERALFWHRAAVWALALVVVVGGMVLALR